MKNMTKHNQQKQSQKPFIGIGSSGLCLLLALAGNQYSLAGQAITGKIIIDGVEYDGSDGQLIKGSGVPSQESRQVAEFSKLVVRGGVDVSFQQNSSTQVIVSGEQNIVPLITTEVREGTLTIDSNRSYQANLPVSVKLAGPDLRLVNLQGAGTINFENMDSDSFDLAISGSSNVNLSGKSRDFSVTINGSGDVDAQQLKSERATVKIAGSGDIKVNAGQSLNAEIIGSGDVNYWGHPETVNKKVVGSGEIESQD